MTFSGGIVTGTGIVDPPNSIVIGASAIVQPGLPIGTLTFQGDTQFGGELDIEIGGASFYDILSVVGAIHFLPDSKIKFIFEGYTRWRATPSNSLIPTFSTASRT